MKNPWKKQSHINPQREDGNRQINNGVFRALIKANLTASEYKVALTVLDKTWGFGKQSDIISTSQFENITGISGRMVKITRKSLRDKRIIHYEPSERVKRGSPFNEYLFNKHYDTWVQNDKKKGEAQFTGEIECKKRVKQNVTATSTKESITKEREDMPYKRIIIYLNRIANKKFDFKRPNTQKHIRARFSDGFTMQDFKYVIDNKFNEWKSDPKMVKYLRPDTLFGTKFESYLNESGTIKPKTEVKGR